LRFNGVLCMWGGNQIERNIKKYGWHCVHVFPDAAGQDKFTYTIGLSETYGGPEVMIFGLDEMRAHKLLGVCASLLEKGNELKVEVLDDRLLCGGYKVMFREVGKSVFGEYLGTAVKYFGGNDFRAVVMFIPDMQGRFPWEKDYAYIPVQESLGIVVPFSFG